MLGSSNRPTSSLQRKLESSPVSLLMVVRATEHFQMNNDKTLSRVITIINLNPN